METIKIPGKIKGFSVVGKDAVKPTPPTPQTYTGSIALPKLPVLAEGSLAFPKRPDGEGFEAWTSAFIRDAKGRKFALSISHIRRGDECRPFEVWALAAEAPPAADLICQLLSQVLLTGDRGFIRYHLNALKKANDAPFSVTLPHGKGVARVGSIGAAIASIVEAHAEHLGYFRDDGSDEASPMLSSMVALREPKGINGAFGPSYSLFNPATGDDTPLFIREVFAEGEIAPTPVSVWFGNGDLPEEAQAILKLLSLAMRHRDAAWIASVLRTLRKHVVVGGELGFAKAASLKDAYYPSTWAYVADLVLARYIELNLLDLDGRPVSQRSLFAPEVIAEASIAPIQRGPGRDCDKCGGLGTVIRMDGCDCCSACAASRCG